MTIDKVALRKAMIEAREALDADERAHAAGSVAAHAEALLAVSPEVSAPVVSSYWAIGPEIDPVSLEAALVARSASLALPVMVGKGKPLLFRRYAHGDKVAPRTWGIHEPLATAASVAPDILLVPLLAADVTGARLGYGGGFYDRTLKALRETKTVVAVGLCYDEQIVDAVPHLHYDERLDWLLTPTGIRKCGPRG
jgi:5-formyltetrahydrofolate cyclo-ligase